MIDQVSGGHLVSTPVSPSVSGQKSPLEGRFGLLFQQEMVRQASPQTAQSVAFSKHAITRAEERGIEVTSHLLDQLASSVTRAQEKGATNILALDATRAFIINVPSAKVITAINQDEMRENIFTNIDGAVFL